jgi:glycosyltransferase involved in cell wall biosynthesis
MTPGCTIICPAYNEANGIETAIGRLRACLDHLPVDAEVLLINDGSTDGTVAAAMRAIGMDPRFRIISHRANFGRGRALRTGFREATGDVIISTEADLSWGSDVIVAMLEALKRDPRLDAVFASPHLPGGGYRNVPWHRILLSRVGNRILRALYPSSISMTTGMTRAYRAGVIRGQTFGKDGKELHLEIAHRLMALGYRIGEVPAVLAWPAGGAGGATRGKRTNWKTVRQLIGSHLAFGFVRGISRIIGPAIVLLGLAIVGFGCWGVWNFVTHQQSIYLVTLTGILLILWVTLVVGYFLLSHVFLIEAEMWRVQELVRAADPDRAGLRQYYDEEPLPGRAPRDATMARSTS